MVELVDDPSLDSDEGVEMNSDIWIEETIPNRQFNFDTDK